MPFASIDGGEDEEYLDLLVLNNANQSSGLFPHIYTDPPLGVKPEPQYAYLLVHTLTL